ncbi:RES family NAD+ phosphorylase [Algoriphagus aestuariicola]|jgi:RES domain-containing protein|uniref:RES family NAD+ phosphorylase n=1 Tax=Algoriphagus aestuariicola TaxID=1852016 RepID=A0ABS3BQP3_9BACT|nr:RES family NAD+ phosphorylase [Algoriphagus aestuariicola]MBN7801581.1 RES family NAD+ phosphorylase [Algoriphagus aestuariicola]
MQVYRLAKSKYAGDISGTGAAIHPGRWNKRGYPVLYTGVNPEIALLEIIVHLPPMLAPALDLLVLELPDNSILELKESDLPSNWSDYPAPTILSEIGQRWIEDGKNLALQVPSSIIKTSSILILNCQHPNYGEVRILERRPFQLDPRLIK